MHGKVEPADRIQRVGFDVVLILLNAVGLSKSPDCPVDYSENMKLTQKPEKLVCPI